MLHPLPGALCFFGLGVVQLWCRWQDVEYTYLQRFLFSPSWVHSTSFSPAPLSKSCDVWYDQFMRLWFVNDLCFCLIWPGRPPVMTVVILAVVIQAVLIKAVVIRTRVIQAVVIRTVMIWAAVIWTVVIRTLVIWAVVIRQSWFGQSWCCVMNLSINSLPTPRPPPPQHTPQISRTRDIMCWCLAKQQVKNTAVCRIQSQFVQLLLRRQSRLREGLNLYFFNLGHWHALNQMITSLLTCCAYPTLNAKPDVDTIIRLNPGRLFTLSDEDNRVHTHSGFIKVAAFIMLTDRETAACRNEWTN